MAKRLAVPSKELQLVVVGPKDSFKVSRGQRLGLNNEIPSTIVDEIGSASHAGEAKDTPNVTLTFSVFDVGIKVFSTLTGYRDWETDRKSTRLNSSHRSLSRMPSSA